MTSLRLRDYLIKGNIVDRPDPATLSPSPGTSVYFWAFDERLMYLLNEDNSTWLAMNTVPEAPIDSQMYMRKDGAWELYVPYTDENVRDVMGTALVGGTGLTKTVDDPGDTITLSIDTTAEAERIRDVMGAALVAGLGLTATVNDPGDTITLEIDTTAEAERIRDVMGAALVAGTNVTLTVNDAGDSITIAASGGSGSALTVKDEGSALDTAVTSINFVGAGVVATNTGHAVTVTVAGGGGSFRGALVKKSADSTGLNYSTAAAVAWDAEEYDTDTIHDNTTNNTRLTVPSGVTKVRLVAQIYADNVSVGANMYVYIKKNASGNYAGAPYYISCLSSTGTERVGTITTPPLTVTAGDYFEVFIASPQDSSITVYGTTVPSWFAMEILF